MFCIECKSFVTEFANKCLFLTCVLSLNFMVSFIQSFILKKENQILSTLSFMVYAYYIFKKSFVIMSVSMCIKKFYSVCVCVCVCVCI
jgi:hypothetical protein